MNEEEYFPKSIYIEIIQEELARLDEKRAYLSAMVTRLSGVTVDPVLQLRLDEMHRDFPHE